MTLLLWLICLVLVWATWMFVREFVRIARQMWRNVTTAPLSPPGVDQMQGPWQCMNCGTVSPPEAFVCYSCGRAKQDVFG